MAFDHREAGKGFRAQHARRVRTRRILGAAVVVYLTVTVFVAMLL